MILSPPPDISVRPPFRLARFEIQLQGAAVIRCSRRTSFLSWIQSNPVHPITAFDRVAVLCVAAFVMVSYLLIIVLCKKTFPLQNVFGATIYT